MMHSASFLLVCLFIQSINALIDPSITQSMVRTPRQFALQLTLESRPLVVNIPINELIRTGLIDGSRFHLNQYEESVAILSGCSNVAFSAPVYINNQGPFKLIVDTGSTTLGVTSSTCQNCSTLTAAQRFDPTGLEPVIDHGGVGVLYADGSSWAGAGYYGSVSVGQPELGGSLAVDMVFGTMEEQTKFLRERACGLSSSQKNWYSGIIGFAYPGLGSKGTDEWFANYVDQTGVANEFTIQMCVTPLGETSGNLWVGAYDKNYVASQFTYVPIVKRDHYNTFLNRIYLTTQFQSVGTQNDLGFTTADYGRCRDDTGLTNDVNCAIVDSGTTYMSFPDTVRLKMIAEIRADPGYQAYIHEQIDPYAGGHSCFLASLFAPFAVLNANLPTMSFVFSDTASGSRPVTIVLEPMNGYLVISYDGSGNKYYCVGIGSTGESAAILGYSFMNQFTIRHDIENHRMGFARTRQCGVAAPIMPNLAWKVSEWSTCDAQCDGYQWRHVNCTDVFGMLRSDTECFDGFAGPKPMIMQPCAQTLCSFISSTKVIDVTFAQTINQLNAGDSVDINFRFTGSPSHIQLYLQPINSVNTWPYIITKNASFVNINPSLTQTGSYRWIVPGALPAGQYVLGGFTQLANNEFIASPSQGVTIIGSNNPMLGQSVCGIDGAQGSPVCSNHGRCTVSPSNQPICTCVTGFSGPSCEISAVSTCSIQCSNEGVADYNDCTCKCPNQFSGVLCEYRFATLTAVLALDPLTVDGLAPGKNHQLFKTGFITDIAHAAGIPTPDVSILSVFPSGSKGLRTAVTFTVAVPASNPDLRTHINFFNTLVVPNDNPLYSSLSIGLFSRYITAMSVVSFPPNSFKLSDPTGDDVLVTLTNHLTLIIGIACGIMGGLMVFCIGCLCFQRHELKKAMSSGAFRRRVSVVKRVEQLNGQQPVIRVQP